VTPPADRFVLHGSDRPLLDAYDALLLDLDGVVYVGGRPVPGAAAAIAAARAVGKPVVFLTNNASRSPGDVAARLSGLGVAAADNDVVTSAQAAARLLAQRLPRGAPVLVLGAAALEAEVRAVALRPVRSASEQPAAVVSGYDEGITYAHLAEAALAIRSGAWWVATNLDATIPTPRGLLPGNGALAALLEKATGVRPVAAGKPEPALFRTALEVADAARPLVVGDRLDTDIAGARAAGCDSLAVLSGVATAADLLAAPPQRRPTFLGRDVGAVLLSAPAVVVADGSGRCGGWSAVVEWEADGTGCVVVSGSGDGLDAVRAAVGAGWAATDATGRPVRAATGLPPIGGR
jgi:HAD superfamily hydrolase (TIGR01450 family)